jgi:hypothetical protein
MEAEAVHAAGIAAFDRGEFALAAMLMEQSIAAVLGAAALSTGRYYRNLCEVYRLLGRYDEALAAGRQAVALAPRDPHGHFNRALVHYDRLELDDAIHCAEQALALDAQYAPAHFRIAAASLLKGDFALGWEEYEWRFGAPDARRNFFPANRPQWDGRALGRRTLLLIADQGFGDIIQFSRFIPWAATRTSNIVVGCGTEVEPILLQQGGVRRLWLAGDKPTDFAAWTSLSGLPRLAGTRLTTIPAKIPYVRAIPAKVAAWAEQLDTRLPHGYRRVGIVWAGRPTHGNDHNRSTTLASLAPLGELPDVALVSVQKGPARVQIADYRGRAPLLDLGDEIGDFADTAAILENLDVLITIDTSVAHLAGAMGKRVWIMLAFAPDWRWLLDRRDSPWYPTARLFRQPAPSRWDLVTGAIANELEGITATHR